MAEQQPPLRVRQPRVFRERNDVLNELSDNELIKRYRLDREGIIFVTDLVRPVLLRPTVANKALTPEQKVIITLRYVATAKMQLCNGDDLGVSQQTVSRVISETLDALCAQPIFKRFIKFPPIQQLQQKKEQFREVAGFPEVVGAIDGTHIRIVKPSEFEVEYVNRKRYHSINVQVVFDAKYNIIDLEARWPGSVHDSRILNESGLKRMFETGAVPAGCHLLGDSGDGCKTWLLTPYLRPQPGYQSNYNRANKKTRSVVEMGIGQWKRRFHVLHSEIRLTPPAKVCKIIFVCAVLHNICKDRNIQLLLEDDPGHDQPPAEDNIQMAANDDDDDQVEPPLAGYQARDGLPYREEFARLHFQ
ncbi:hypothetical protein Pcinc_009081 [Petrolisthes cinctipes]|uniref:Putative nuclease HARBI1 n=1 Tax=Petrolisthes cinctipes TaxID=88211 RepID=A0AAE1KV56_PETCI|nr:hypothetical protein Pcinc_009081 [Petrolisthes cinctipes]